MVLLLPVGLAPFFLVELSLCWVLPALSPSANSWLQPPPSAGSSFYPHCLQLQILGWPEEP